jgi:hypothetical protein
MLQAKAYTFWRYMSNARARNVGWRLDYFLTSARIVDDHVADTVIRSQGSILRNSILADKFSSSNFGQIYTQRTIFYTLILDFKVF